VLVDLPLSVNVIDLLSHIFFPLVQELIEALLHGIKPFFPLNPFQFTIWIVLLLNLQKNFSISQFFLFLIDQGLELLLLKFEKIH